MTASTLAIIDNEITGFVVRVGTPDILNVPAGFLDIIAAGLVLDFVSKSDRFTHTIDNIKTGLAKFIRIWTNLDNY